MGEVTSESTGEVQRMRAETEVEADVEPAVGVEVGVEVEEDPWAIARYGRRHAPRIGPPEDEPLACALKPPRGEACPGEVRDLSALGLGIWVGAEEAQVLENAIRVQIYLAFPRAGDALEFDATIRRRSVQGDRLFLACEIEDGSSPAERAGRERLAAWVGERFARP